MKLFKKLAVGALALALASMASATTVKVTGSTAFRKALYISIINQLGGPGVCRVAWYGNASMTSAAQAVFTNGTDTVQACMAGSVGGVNWIVNDANAATVAPFDPTYSTKVNSAWLSVSNCPATSNVTSLGVAPSYNATFSTTVLTSPVFDAASKADFTMSDSLQASTPYTSTALVNAGSANIGVVQFVFAKGQNSLVGATADGRFTNMSALGFRNLASNGYEQLSAFTGNTADDGVYVCLVGRDSDSGTRLGTAYETAIGNVTSPLTQWKGYTSGGVDVAVNGGTIAYINPVTGTDGYASGGQVKTMLNYVFTGAEELGQGNGPATFILVGYVGLGDVPTVGTNRILSYNGVVQSDAATQNGQYTFWTHEQAYYKSTLAPAIKTIADAIANGVKNTYAPASGGVLESTMKAARASEGAVVYRTI